MNWCERGERTNERGCGRPGQAWLDRDDRIECSQQARKSVQVGLM